MFMDIKRHLSRKSSLFLGLFFIGITAYLLTRRSVDFYPFYNIARNILYLGKDLYGPNPAFSYPPFFYCIVSFFAVFTEKIALLFWTIFNICLITSAYMLIVKIVAFFEPANTRLVQDASLKRKAIVILPFMVMLGIVADNLNLGQVNPLTFFLSVLSIYAALKEKHIISGVSLGIAIAIKVTPALMILFFLIKGYRKFLPWCLLTVLACFTVIPLAFFGYENTLKFTSDFFNLVILPFFRGDITIRETSGFWHSNQSFDGFFGRHFTPFGREYYGAAHMFDPAFLDLAGAKKLSLAVKIVTSIILLYAVRGSIKSNQGLLKFEFAAGFIFILLVSPASWLNHYITVMFAYYVAVNYITSKGNNELNKKILGGCLMACCALTATGALYLSVDLPKVIQSMSGMFLGHLILFIGIVTVLIREKKSIHRGKQ